MGKLHIIPFIVAAIMLLMLVSGSMAAPAKGVIYVDSTPQGADIYLTNNTSVTKDNLTVEDTAGITPREFFVDPNENYKLFVKKYGYTTWWTGPFSVQPGQYHNFTATLNASDPQYGAIHIDTQPPGARLELQRIIPNDTSNITSMIYSSTPASVESLPPGMYNYNLTMDGYLPNNSSAQVVAGEVTEIYVPLEPIPDTGVVTFKTEPTGARVFLFGGDISVLSQEQILQVKEVMNTSNISEENLTQKINSIVGTESVPPYYKFVAGFVGTTPFDRELYKGNYTALYFLDGYHMDDDSYSMITVKPEEKKTITQTLVPNQEYVEVYFETSIDAEGGAWVSVEGGYPGPSTPTPCWVELPSNHIVNVTFNQLPLYAPKKVMVDTTLFEGRPSKWGDIIQLDLMDYYLTLIHDANSSFVLKEGGTLEPSGLVKVKAGGTAIFTLLGNEPVWVIDNLTVTLDGFPPQIYTEFHGLYSQDYPHSQVLQNATLNLTSTKKQVAVNATASKGGSVNLPGIHYYDYGASGVHYVFTPDTNYSFEKLILDNTESWYNTIYDFTPAQMQTNHSLYGVFNPTQVLITPLATTGGRILDGGVNATPYWIPYNTTTHQHEAVADEGYRFVKFDPVYSEESVGALTDHYYWEHPQTKSNITVTAIFEPVNYTVSSRAEVGGSISPVLTNATASYGQKFSFVSTSIPGYVFSDIKDNGISQGALNPYNITVNQSHDIVAYFQSDVLTITAVAGEGGKIKPNGTVNVTFGDSQCFNITANTNYNISSVVVDGVNKGNVSSYCFDRVTSDHNITANFVKNSYTITPTAGTGGTITPSTPQNVPAGGSITFTITNTSCYNFGDVKVDGVSKGTPTSYTFSNVTVDHTISASFDAKKYKILVNQSVGGNITPAGTDGIVGVTCGATQCFNMTPDSGNVLDGLIVDNKSVSVENPYCFANITADHTIEPVFVLPPIPDFGADMTRVPPKYKVTFKDFTRNNPTDLKWEFGDGQSSYLREPTHLYNDVGNYTITLTAYNAAAPEGVKVVKENFIQVTTNPIANFTARPKGGIVPPSLEVEFIDSSLNTDGVAYGWVFGDTEDGAISRNATHNYTAPGVYQVTHQVEKPFIAKDYAYATITVLQKPVADFIAHPVSGKAPLSVQFEDKSQGFPTSWFWDFGDNEKSSDQSPIHVYGDSGSYNVTLSVFSDEGSSVKSKPGFITVQ